MQVTGSMLRLIASKQVVSAIRATAARALHSPAYRSIHVSGRYMPRDRIFTQAIAPVSHFAQRSASTDAKNAADIASVTTPADATLAADLASTLAEQTSAAAPSVRNSRTHWSINCVCADRFILMCSQFVHQ
jgi:hypothetical protein